MWPWKERQPKQEQEGIVIPSHLSVEENRRITALSFAIGSYIPDHAASPDTNILETARQYLTFLTGESYSDESYSETLPK